MKRLLLPIIGVASVLLLLCQSKTVARNSPAAKPSQSAEARITAEARVVAYPGGEVELAAETTGAIRRLLVEEKQIVKRGELLGAIESDELRASLHEARARVVEAEADIRLAAAEVERAEKLWREDVGSKQLHDRAIRDRDAAIARHATAQATARRIEASIDKTRIVAPIDGVVVARNVDAGETVETGDPLLTIADLSRLRLEAEVDEFDVDRVRLGAEAIVKADGFPGTTWRGRVEEIPDRVTGRRLKPDDPATLVDTRVLLVKIALLDKTPLKLGQRVDVELKY